MNDWLFWCSGLVESLAPEQTSCCTLPARYLNDFVLGTMFLYTGDQLVATGDSLSYDTCRNYVILGTMLLTTGGRLHPVT